MKMKKILFLIVITSLFFGLTFIKSSAKNENEKNNEKIIAVVQDNIKLENYEKELTKVYGKNFKQILLKNEKLNEQSGKIYDAINKNKLNKYFAGTYIDDNQKMHLNVLDVNKINNILNSNLLMNEDIVIENVENSLDDLILVNDKIIKYFSSGKTLDGFLASYIDIEANLVVVELDDLEFETINNFEKNIVKSNLIKFKKGFMKEATSTINAGSSLNGNCSIGYRAKLNGKTGFVTAGHCVTGVGQTISGYGTVKKYKIGGSIDAAWIESSQTLTNNLDVSAFPATGLNTNEPNFQINVGTIVNKIGISTGFQSGKVTSLFWSGNISYGSYSKYLTNLVVADVKTVAGDSGGIIFGSGSGKVPAIGICTAGSTNTKELLFTRGDKIKDEFGIVRY